MKGWRESFRTIPLLFALFFSLHFPVENCCAQEKILSREPFRTQKDLAPSASASGDNWKKPTSFPLDIPGSDLLPPSSDRQEENEQKQEAALGAYRWGIFSFSLSTLNNGETRRDISRMEKEKSRLEMIRSMTSEFSDMPSWKRFQYFGEIIAPELKLQIEF